MNTVKEQLVNIRNNRRINIKTCINDKNHTSILLIHGSMASLEQYNYQFDYLIQQRPDINIIAYDTYGCGKSDKNLDDFEAYNTRELELDMLAVFDKFKRKKNIVVGHSYGTSMCLRLSYLRQNEVDGAICIAAGQLEDYGPGLFKLPLFLLKCIKPMLSKGFLERAFHEKTLQLETEHHKEMIESVLKASGKNEMFIAQAFYSQMQWIKKKELNDLTEVPILFISGSHDRLLPHKDHALKVATQIPDHEHHTNFVTIEVVEDTGHQVHMEDPIVVNELINRFINRVL